MDNATAHQLNAINRAFYAAVADDFDATRQGAWAGWLRLREHLPAAVHAVLDVGCGNGRFGVWLGGVLTQPFAYTGVDNSAALLDRAGAALAGAGHNAALTLIRRDLVDAPLTPGALPPADVVVAFGVLHHMPGRARRLALVAALASCVRAGGVLAFACWRFLDVPRLRARLGPFPPDLAPHVEPGDYLLDWRRGTNALRYCHYVDDAEHAALIAAAGLPVAADFRADGETGDANRYTVFSRR